MLINKFPAYIFLIIAITISGINLSQKIHYSPDDTFIYMQYARNIVSGHEFAFNAGEPSYGITGPVWALMVSGGYLTGLEGFWFAKLMDLIFAFLAAFMFYKLAGEILKKLYADNKEKIRHLQFLSTSVFILNSWFIRWSFTGMETSFAIFLLLLIFYLIYREKYIGSFALT